MFQMDWMFGVWITFHSFFLLSESLNRKTQTEMIKKLLMLSLPIIYYAPVL